MYNPKIKESFIPILYQIKQVTKKPITVQVNEALEQYLQKEKELVNKIKERKWKF